MTRNPQPLEDDHRGSSSIVRSFGSFGDRYVGKGRGSWVTMEATQRCKGRG